MRNYFMKSGSHGRPKQHVEIRNNVLNRPTKPETVWNPKQHFEKIIKIMSTHSKYMFLTVAALLPASASAKHLRLIARTWGWYLVAFPGHAKSGQKQTKVKFVHEMAFWLDIPGALNLSNIILSVKNQKSWKIRFFWNLSFSTSNQYLTIINLFSQAITTIVTITIIVTIVVC